MTVTEWIFRCLSALLATLAVGMVAFGWWVDRWRGRTKSRRCPKCWYDLSGTMPSDAGAWLCAECGHVESREVRLHRARRRWWIISAALPIALLAGLAWVWPTIDRDGWRAAVPTWVIVRYWPIDEVAWMEGRRGKTFGMLDELDQRMDVGKLSAGDARVWSDRVIRTFAHGEERRLRVIRVDMPPGVGSTQVGRSGDPDDEVWIWQEGTEHIVTSAIAAMSWASNGGVDGSIRRCGRSLLVLSVPRVLEDVEHLVAAIDSAAEAAAAGPAASIRVVAHEDATRQIVIRDVRDIESDRATPATTSDERISLARDRIISNVEPDSWIDNGGETGMAWMHRGLLIIRHTPEIQAKVDQYLAQVRAGQSL